MPGLDALFDLLQLAIKERTQLALENIALRQQLAVYKRSVKRPNINDGVGTTALLESVPSE